MILNMFLHSTFTNMPKNGILLEVKCNRHGYALKTPKIGWYNAFLTKKNGTHTVSTAFNTSQSGLCRQKPSNGSKTKKDIFKTLKHGGLVQQTVQIVVRFALTI